MRKTAMREKMPPRFEHNSTEHLSVSAAAKPAAAAAAAAGGGGGRGRRQGGTAGSAVFLAPSASQSATTLPGVNNVRAYASTPTRDDRLAEATRATKARADQARGIATKAQRDQKLMLAAAMAAKEGGSFKLPPGQSSMLIRAPRARALEEQAWREALKAKARGIAATSPSRVRMNPDAVGPRTRRCFPRRDVLLLRARTPLTVETTGRFQAEKDGDDAFGSPFAGGNEGCELPGKIESLLYPQRYVDWPQEDAPFPTLATDIRRSPIRHAVAFRSNQPRIVCIKSCRETTGWDGPGAYEWDKMADKSEKENNKKNDDVTPRSGGGDSGCDDDADGGGGGRGTRPRPRPRDRARTKGMRPKGIRVKEPERQSPAFRGGETRFIHPNSPNVRGFAVVPSISGGGVVAGDEEAKAKERGAEGDDRGSETSSRRRMGGSIRPQRKPPQRLWMFQPAGLPYEPASATEGWDGPGAYAMEGNTAMRVKEPGRVSPAFRESSARRTLARLGTAGNGSLDIMPKWIVPSTEFTPPEPKTIVHDARHGPMKFGACFLSVTDRFEPVGPYAFTLSATPPAIGPGAGEGFRGDRTRGFLGPVQKYDLVGARQQRSASKAWLTTSICPGLSYNPALTADAPVADTTASVAPAAEFSPLEINSPFAASLQQQTCRPDSANATAAAEPLQASLDLERASIGFQYPTAPAGTEATSGGMDNPVSPPAVVAVSVGAQKRAKDASRRNLPAARAMKVATAAAVADGLARGWPEGRWDIDVIAGGGGKGGRGGTTSEEQHMSRTVLQDAGCPGSTSPQTHGGVGENNVDAKATMLPPDGRRGGTKVEDMPKQEPGGVIMFSTGHSPISEVSGVSIVGVEVSEPGAESADTATTEDTEMATAGGQARSHPTETRKTRVVAHRMSRKAINVGIAKRRSVKIKPKRNGCTDTTHALGLITKGGLAATEAAIAAAEVAKSKRRPEGLIKMIGRAKRGPCMLTLTASAQAKETAGANSARSKQTWQPEATGGLLGPGKSKILVC